MINKNKMAKLRRFWFYQDKYKINTENPETEIWTMIMKFSDIFYLKKKWKSRDNSDYLKVSSWLKQSNEFHIAANNADINTKPLLMYYSFLNLSKAIYFIVKDKKPNSEYHWLASPIIWENFLDISVNVKGGVFKDICELTWDNSDSLSDKINIKRMLDNFLEINKDYIDYFDVESVFLKPKVNVYLDWDIEIFIQDSSNYIKGFFNWYEIKKNENWEDFFYNNISSTPENDSILDKEFSNIFQYNTIEDSIYYINKNPDSISNVASIYWLIFILGNIVRYKPEYFYKITNDPNDSIPHFINQILKISNRTYPNLMLNLLYWKNIVFSK